MDSSVFNKKMDRKYYCYEGNALCLLTEVMSCHQFENCLVNNMP